MGALTPMRPDERVTVRTMPPQRAPLEWRPTLRLIEQLVEIFPDQVIDIDEVPPHIPDSQPQED